jgi:hypothetical protein
MQNKQNELARDLHSEWEQALGHPLTPTEFEELKENLLAFFTLLHEWQREDEQASRNGNARLGGERE